MNRLLSTIKKPMILLTNISITELTWKILFDLYMIYSKRGNISRMKEFGNYANQIIFYIADQIKSSKLKKLYLEKPERQKAISFLERNKF